MSLAGIYFSNSCLFKYLLSLVLFCIFLAKLQLFSVDLKVGAIQAQPLLLNVRLLKLATKQVSLALTLDLSDSCSLTWSHRKYQTIQGTLATRDN
jgi:hypothetical protein